MTWHKLPAETGVPAYHEMTQVPSRNMCTTGPDMTQVPSENRCINLTWHHTSYPWKQMHQLVMTWHQFCFIFSDEIINNPESWINQFLPSDKCEWWGGDKFPGKGVPPPWHGGWCWLPNSPCLDSGQSVCPHPTPPKPGKNRSYKSIQIVTRGTICIF